MAELPSLSTLSWLAVAIGGVLALALGAAWWVHLRAVRKAHRRAAGRRLVESVKAYGAWIDCQRAEPLLDSDTDDLPEPLRNVVALKDAHFPELAPAVMRLLRTHAAMTEMLWQHHILRITRVEPQTAVYADPAYQALRDQHDAAIDGLIAQCRLVVGDEPPQWRRTRSDFGFTGSSLGLPSHPGRP